MVENPSHLEFNPCVIACAVRISSRSSVPGAWWMVSDRNVQDHEDDLLDFYLQMFIPLSSSLESIQTPWKCSVKVIFCSTMLQNVSSTFEDQHQYGGSPEWRGGTHPSPNLSVNDLWSYGWRNLCKWLLDLNWKLFKKVPSSLTEQCLGERRTPLPQLTEARRPVCPRTVLSFKITGLEMQSSPACLMGKVWLFECSFRRLAGFGPHVFIAAFQHQTHLL